MDFPGFEDCDQYSIELLRAKEYLLDLETSGVEALNPRPLPYPPDNPEQTLRAKIEQTRRELTKPRHQVVERGGEDQWPHPALTDGHQRDKEPHPRAACSRFA